MVNKKNGILQFCQDVFCISKLYLAGKLIQPQFILDNEVGTADADDVPPENEFVTNEINISGKSLSVSDEYVEQ